MIRIIETLGSNLPKNYQFDIKNKLQSGQIGCLKIKNNKLIIDVCDGLNPIGIIDNVKINRLRKIVVDEEINIPYENLKCEIKDGETLYTLKNTYKTYFKIKNIIGNSFSHKCTGSAAIIINRSENSIIVGKNSLLKDNIIKINYAYNIEMSNEYIAESDMVTLLDNPMIVETDMFDASYSYPIRANLYVNNGFITTKKIAEECKCVGMVLYPPTAENPVLKYLFDINN